MGKKKFVTVNRVANRLYWDCPGKGCAHYYDMVESEQLPRTIHCHCGTVHIVKQIVETTRHTARVLMEIIECT